MKKIERIDDFIPKDIISKTLETYNETNARDIIITIPAKIKWIDYEKELAAAERGDILNYKTHFLPKNIFINKSKCYICYKNYIIGYHIICGISKDGFKCTTTGQIWNGNFIQRTGKFIKLETPIACKGFQGFRYTDFE